MKYLKLEMQVNGFLHSFFSFDLSFIGNNGSAIGKLLNQLFQLRMNAMVL
jgi:hypothetical protein